MKCPECDSPSDLGLCKACIKERLDDHEATMALARAATR